MPLLQFIPIKLTAALIAGILLAFYISPDPLFPYSFLGIGLFGLAIAYKTQKRNRFPLFGIFALLTTVGLGLVVTQFSLGKGVPNYYQERNLDQSHSFYLKIDEVLKSSPYADRYYAQILTIDGFAANGRIAMGIFQTKNAKLGVDDEIWVHTQLKSIAQPKNPHQFDYQNYLEKQGIFHQINVNGDHYLSAQNASKTLFGRAHRFREHLIAKLRAYGFGENEQAVMQALLLGERSELSEETYTDYKNAGAVHILAVSGLHVGVLLLLLQFLAKPLERLPYGRSLKLITIISALWTFAFIAGLSPSIVRAVTMFSFLAYALHLNRPTNTFNIIALSLFFILLIRPLFLFQVGFQMSYAAVIAIVWLYPKLQRFWYPKNRIVRKIWQLLSVSATAQLGVLPIALYYFHQFPALFFISNLVIVPFLGVILAVGLLVLFLAAVNYLPNILVMGYNTLIAYMNRVVAWVGNQEAFVFKDISFDGPQLILGYGLILLAINALQRPKFRNLAFLSMGILLFQGWLMYLGWKNVQTEQLVVGHQTANSILLHQNKGNLTVHASNSGKGHRIIEDYKIGERLHLQNIYPLRNSYVLGDELLLVVDSAAIIPKIKADYLLLVQSPHINLDRLLDTVRPKVVLVDGSNYRSDVRRWQRTCTKRKLPFHNTGEKGAYIFN